MDSTLLAATIAAASSAVVSLAVAIINWRSSRNLERVKRSYDLSSKDLDRLLQIKATLAGLTVPSDERLQNALNIVDLKERDRQLQKALDEVTPLYEKVCEMFLLNEDLFDELARAEFKAAIEGSDSWVGGELLGRRLLAVGTITRAMLGQVERTRKRLSA